MTTEIGVGRSEATASIQSRTQDPRIVDPRASGAPVRDEWRAPGSRPTANRRKAGQLIREWPTWAMLAACYGLWATALIWHETLGIVGFMLLGGYSVALHASLTHEVLHGHPTRSAVINEALVFTSLNLLTPYRRFKELHLKHHNDERLTDPYDDPESYYLAEGDWNTAPPALRAVLRVNGTLAGRMLIGPWLSIYGLWRADLREALGGPRRARIIDAYLRHAVGVCLTLSAIIAAGVDPLSYLLLAVWPGYALLMLRTYAEHRAAAAPGRRTAIVEAEPLFGLLFLNNNLHALHHARPTTPWYELPAVWRRERAETLARNGGYLINGYFEVARRWMFVEREPVPHPILRRRLDDRGE